MEAGSLPQKGRTVPICGDSGPLLLAWLAVRRRASLLPWQRQQASMAHRRQRASCSICPASRRNFSAAIRVTAPNIERWPSCQLGTRRRRGR